VVITGTARVGETLTADTSGLTNAAGTLHYQWKAAAQHNLYTAVDIGAESATYTLTEAELANYIYVTVTSSGNSGSVGVWTDTLVTAPIAEFDLAATVAAAVTAQTTAGGTNAAATPATVILPASINISDEWGKIDAILKTEEKFVILDLSACSATDNTIAGNESAVDASSNEMNIIFNNTYLKGIIFPDSLTSIGDYSFRDCQITSVTIPSGVLSIGVRAFGSCSSLTTVVFLGSSAVVANTNSFANSATLLTAGEATAGETPMAAGTYTKSGTTWTKQP